MPARIRLRFIPHFVTDAGATVAFVPLANAPGFTHRVIINRRSVDWLAEGHPPNAKAARYFIEKHPAAVAAVVTATITHAPLAAE